ncbi:integrase [Bradyrhizobium japonicum]
MLTAQRRGEVASMMRSELHGLHGEKPHWIIPAVRTKNKKAEHTVPLFPTAVKLIEAALEIGKPEKGEDQGNRPVVASRFESVGVLASHCMSQAVRRLLEDNELVAFTPHDLRRTAATIVHASIAMAYVRREARSDSSGLKSI